MAIFFIKKFLLWCEEQKHTMTKMNERTLNTLFNIVSDPIKNAYVVKDNKSLAEIQNIIRILNITNEQKTIAKEISARGLVAFKMLVSNN